MTNDGSLPEEHLNLAMALFTSTTVITVFYILIFLLYCLSFRLSYPQLRNDRGKIDRHTVWILVFQTVLLTCATLDLILLNRDTQVRYIDNGASPGGPLGISATTKVGTILKIRADLNIVENILILGVLVWRVRVVWSGTRLATPLTVVSLFLYLVDVGLGLSYNVIWEHIDDTNLAVTVLFIMAMAFELASNVFMTSAIVARLLFVRQKHIKVMGKSDIASQYWGIAAMLIESYALDTVWAIGMFISYILNYAPTNYLFSLCVVQVDILTAFLLTYRVFSGRAWTRQTQDRLSTLRWGSNGVGITASGAVSVGQVNIPEEDPPGMCSRNDV